MRASFLLITANVGSLFEESCRIHEIWLRTLFQTVQRSNADFVALHMQEVGGKNYERCTGQVPGFIQKLTNYLSSLGYTTARVYLDLEYELSATYVALGSLYFVKNTCKIPIEQYDFKANRYSKIENDFSILKEGLVKCSRIRKAKFPQDFWPTIRWTRKGFMHCRFKFNRTPIDFVNVHLFHDDSNIALVHENPSLYSENRRRALNYVLDEVKKVEDRKRGMLLYIFGDLNFRLDHASFLNRITECTDQRHDSVEFTDNMGFDTGSMLTVESDTMDLLKPIEKREGENLRRTVSAIEFRRSPSTSKKDLQPDCVLRIEKKRFDYFNQLQLRKDWEGYLEDDKEVLNFPSLKELKHRFPPTYPWSEDPDESEMLMNTRAPAWCDRILMNSRAYDVVCSNENVTYDSIGQDVCMGDHKVTSDPHIFGRNLGKYQVCSQNVDIPAINHRCNESRFICQESQETPKQSLKPSLIKFFN